MSGNPIILNFNDTLLRKSDLELLHGPHWLNDNIITFYFEYLEKKIYFGEENLLFVGPEVVQCLKASHCSDLGVFLDPLSAKQKKFIFLALNNCEVLDKAGGSHWSLLVYSQPERTFYHFDSLRGTNYNQAWKFSRKFQEYFALNGKGDYIEQDCLQQCNGYDCGIFVLCHVDLLVNYCLKYNKINGCDNIVKQFVDEKRTNILKIISDLQSKGY